jgi:ribosomal protein S18 acetylase RimI-like enzyme
MINSSDLVVKEISKSQETFSLMSLYFKVGKFKTYMADNYLFQVGVFYNGELVGLRWLKMKDNLIQLQYSVVKEDYRGNGINGLMLKWVDQAAVENGVDLVTVHVRESNIASLKSLQKAGFIVNENATGFYANNEKKINLYKRYD